ncbi:D-Ala-D-Ala carboxypeptidase family metallohydrolase [Saccharothrix violaceirubra]|uniref:Peptidoglycan hydrolase-like protein with peptidoglycan-binding domain n=1 Tax=Saccharothrix violaceirubra TaxID=413306 RepID=A0A7W7WWM5_9PSEU|nr:peptidoglycan-binding protein [Saccharothrix violaceirubra]MBB4966500.1 peptidoglycan hydrolase-like protein with peptidoglycan-binding domain [Saccharothrix violaceirubra]
MTDTARRTVLLAVAAAPFAALLAPGATARAAGLDTLEIQIRVAGWAADEPRQVGLALTGRLDAPTKDAVRRFQGAHGLRQDGIVDERTREALTALAKPDGSTRHFDWTAFSPDGTFAGGAADEATVREHVRRLMYRLEALRHKVDGREITVTSGFHTHGGAHALGGAADVVIADSTTYAAYRAAQTCGFTELGMYTQSWLHVDILPSAFTWADGVV